MTTGVDKTTGEVVDTRPLKARIAELEQEVERLQGQVRIELNEKGRLHARIGALQAERNNHDHRNDPFYRDGREIFDYWRRLLRAAGRDAVEFGETRWQPVRARLAAGYTIEQIKAAIDVAFRLPETMSVAQRRSMQELEYIVREPEHLDRFLAEAGPVTGDQLELGGQPVEPNGNGQVVPAPVDAELDLELDRVPVLVPNWPVTCVRGCDHERIARALWPWWQFSGNPGCPSCMADVVDVEGRRSSEWVWEQGTPGLFGSPVIAVRRLRL